LTIKTLLDDINENTKKILVDLNFPNISFVVESAKPGFGDATCNVAFLLSKPLKKSPYEIAQLISEKYQNFLGDLVSRVEAHKSGYVNFFANIPKINEMILKASDNDDYGFVDVGKKSKIVIEHTSVNPNKALHIGHVRNIVIGDTLARILTKANYNVKVLNYVDDSGLQVADIIVGFKFLNYSTSPPSGEKFDQYCGDYVYVKTNEKYSSDPKLEENRRTVLQQLEDENSEVATFADKITKMVLAEQLKTCWKLSVTYDCLNFESQIIRSGLWAQIFKMMKDSKLIEFETEGDNSGCWVLRGDGNDDDKVVVRSNGTATYIAKDIPYAFWKLGLVDDPFNYKKYFIQENKRILWQTTLEESSDASQNFTGEKAITVIDTRQSRLQKIIRDLVSKIKSEENTYVHLGYESVTLSSYTATSLGLETQGKQVQMSGRKGLYVNADSVISLLEQKTFEETKKRNADLDGDSISKISNDIAVGTIRYEMIKPDLDRILTFDLKTSLSLEGDTASYIQYTHARATRILEKADFSPNYDADYTQLDSEYEVNLVKTIGKFDLQIIDAAKNLAPKVIAKYCHDLAVSFNAFYEHIKVLGIDDKSLENVRLCLVNSFQSTLESALDLIGIRVPMRM